MFTQSLHSVGLQRVGLQRVAVGFMGFALAWAAASAAQAEPTVVPLETYKAEDGKTLFALAVAPTMQRPAAGPTDVVILFDTSASQAREYRTKGLETLDVLLRSLAPDSQAQLLAVDTQVIPLTSEFAAPQSAAMTEAVRQLHARVPLGATDMEAALSQAADILATAPVGRNRAVIYLGDGVSAAQFIATPRMERLLAKLVAARAPVSSYGFGPRVDDYLLGAVANHTGGILGLDSEELTAQQAGAYLAAAAGQPVVWPQSLVAPAGATLYPAQVPPLRFDRETVLIGKSADAPSGELRFTGEVAGQPVEFAWNLTAEAASPDNNYLVDLVGRADRDRGLGLPLLGSVGLRGARGAVNLKAHGLAMLSQQAASLGSLDQAMQLADEALRLDANNPQATAVRSLVDKQRSSGEVGPRDIQLINFQGADGVARTPEAGEGDFLSEVEELRRVQEAMLRAEVQRALNQARSLLGTSPQAAKSLLKPMLEQVRLARELSPEVKQQLVEQIQTSLREASRQEVVKTERDLRNQELEAERIAREQLTRDLIERTERTKQLMDRFEGLMAEGRFGDARNMALAANELSPNTPATDSAVRAAETFGAIASVQRIRDERAFNYYSMLEAAEKSAMPFNDNIPVVYPDPEVWRELTERRAKYNKVDLYSGTENETKIVRALDENTELDVIEAPLSDVMRLFETRHKIPIKFDHKALEAIAVQIDTPVTQQLRGISLRSALRLVLRDLALTYVVRDEVLLITSQSAAEDVANYGSTKVYPVADLVMPVSNPGMSGFGGLGGGGMGGLGMSGGGMGGGMGGGGMGGGGFGGGFAVPDDLVLTGDAPSTPAAAAAPPAQQPAAAQQPVGQPAAPRHGMVVVPQSNLGPISTIQLTTPATMNPQEAWQQYFAANQADPASVRETVRQLMQAKKYDHVAALVEAALLHSQHQPWMYEALGIALQLEGATPEHIERAMMSAVDFSRSRTDLIHVARYMTRSMQGNRAIEQRALRLFEQVAQLEPTHPEAYVEGLDLAVRLGDLEGIRWATVGVLSQAWSQDQQVFVDRATRVAYAAYEQLLAEKRTDEAAAFKAELDEALVRDCVIIVSWTGDADIDMLVEEPSGSICSLRTPRSTGGGTLLADLTASTKAGDVQSEVYICPQGFDGTYKILLRKVWGKPTVDRVTVDFYSKRGSKEQRHLRKQISLEDGQASLGFEFAGGRRTEPLAEQQLANAVAGQMAIGQAILGQQLSALSDADGLPRQLANDRAALNPNNPNNALFPFLGVRPGVGYQPIIITLPEGANMSAIAVVSADRRYVRCTTQPLFSTIPTVNVFNYATGSSGTSRGGTTGT